jgi:hypothetical protein
MKTPRENEVITARPESKTITAKKPVVEEAVPEKVSQRRKPEAGPFRLQVDRQTKSSYTTLEAAEQAGLAIKKEHPIVQVAVYDSVNSTNTIIEAPKA